MRCRVELKIEGRAHFYLAATWGTMAGPALHDATEFCRREIPDQVGARIAVIWWSVDKRSSPLMPNPVLVDPESADSTALLLLLEDPEICASYDIVLEPLP